MPARPAACARAAVALVALCLVLPASGHAVPYDWAEAADVVASPDGRHVYAAGQTTLSFRVDQASGALELIGHTEPGGGYHPRIAMARGGRFTYVATGKSTSSPNAVHVLTRDAESGLLTHESTFRGSGDIGAVMSLTPSADGTQLYLGQHSPSALAVYDVDPDSGALTLRQALYGRELPSQAYDIAPAPDGRHVYLAGDAIGILARDTQTGMLSAAGADGQNGTMWSLALSPDGLRVYGAQTDVQIWRRDPQTGGLSAAGYAQRPGETCSRCNEGQLVSPAPDGRAVFTAEEIKRRLVQWRVTDSGLAFERNYTEGEEGFRGLANPMAMAWSPDGRFAYVAASEYQTEAYISSRGSNGSVASFRRTETGLELASVVGPRMEVPDTRCQPGLAGLPAVSIEDGALYTNSADVSVTVTCPRAASVRLSNLPGDFAGARATRVFGDETPLPWRLDTSGAERDVKRVHVRFTAAYPGQEPGDLFDDIILDQRPPQVVTARLRDARVRLKARDNRSGVKRLQVTTSKKRPGKARRYSSSAKVSGNPKSVFVRVFDGAGNASAWKVARRP